MRSDLLEQRRYHAVERMRILALNYEHPPLGGGGGVAAANLCQELARRGHELDYVTSHWKGLERQEFASGVQLYRERVWGRKDLHTATTISMLSYPATAIPRALRLARSHSYDIVHTHFAIPTGPVGSIVSRWLGLPNLLSVYGGDIYDPSKSASPHAHPVLGRVVRSVLAQADLVVADSQDVAERARGYGAKTEVAVVPPGFVLPDRESCSRADLDLNEDSVYAIAVSRLVPRKAYGDLLGAIKIANVSNLELLIIGDGPEGPELRRLANELGIAPRVHFLGRQDDRRKYQYLENADFFALASLHEGFGIVYQEAMYAGLPVVTTNSGGQVDFLKHGENALLSAPGRPGEMAENLKRMGQDVMLREKMSRANRNAIQDQLIESTTARHLELYERIIAGKRSSRGSHAG